MGDAYETSGCEQLWWFKFVSRLSIQNHGVDNAKNSMNPNPYIPESLLLSGAYSKSEDPRPDLSCFTLGVWIRIYGSWRSRDLCIIHT